MTGQFDDNLRDLLASRCAAFARIDYGGTADFSSLKRAAVAIALVADDDGSPAFLLTRRASGLRSHASQWALPGGRCDAHETVEAAALRELQEELGLLLDSNAVIGLLDDYPTRSGYLITPVLLWAKDAGSLTPNADEVSAVHRIRLAQIAKDDAVDLAMESGRPMVRIHMAGNWVNAPTAAVIYQFRELLAGRETRVSDFDQPQFAWR